MKCHKRYFLFNYKGLLSLLILALLAYGTSCSGKAKSTDGSGASSSGTGINIGNLSNLPSLDIDDYDFVGVTSTADLSAPVVKGLSATERLKAAFKHVSSSDQQFSESFCHQKACLIQMLRQVQDIEVFTCFMKAISASDSRFTFTDDNDWHYFSMTVDSPIDTFEVLVRLKQNGEKYFVQVSEGGVATDELVFDQTTVNGISNGIRGSVTHIFTEGMDTFKGQFGLQANCKPAEFLTNDKCRFGIDSKFDDPFGEGTINFSVKGGASATEILHNLEANFAAGAAGASSTNASSILLKSEWAAGTGATGASNVDFGSGGTYPAFSQNDFTGGNANDPIFTVCPKADFYCDNPKFDPSDLNSCPVVVAPASGACPIPASKAQFTDCYSIDGTALLDQVGYVLDCADSSVATHHTAVITPTDVIKSKSISFVESWDGAAEGTPIELDLSSADLSSCLAVIQEAAEDIEFDSCQEQGATARRDEGDYCDADDDDDGVANCDDPCPGVDGVDCTGDFDGDDVDDDVDNCPYTPNMDQADADADDIGDACADFSDVDDLDLDGDGIDDAEDNCLFDDNEDQADADSDDFGDECDPCPDDETDACLFEEDTASCSIGTCNVDFDCQKIADDEELPVTTYVCDVGSGCCVDNPDT